MKIAAIVVLLFVGISITTAHAQMFLLHVGSGGFGNGGGGPPANALLSQTGVCILAQTGSCILVQ